MTPEETRELIAEARDRASAMPTFDLTGQCLTACADALSALLPVPDGDARERLVECVDTGIATYLREDLPEDGFMEAEVVADAILAAFPILGRDIAGEIEAVANAQDDDSAEEVAYIRGLRRAAEIVRSGR